MRMFVLELVTRARWETEVRMDDLNMKMTNYL